MRLNGKGIVITGAAGLLGVQHAEAVLEEGGRVLLLDSNQAKLDAVSQYLHSKNFDEFLIYKCDITIEQNVSESLGIFQEKFGLIHGLINNAAVNPKVEEGGKNFTRVEQLRFDTWQTELNVGLWGAFICSKLCGANMIKNNIFGSLVHVSSDHGLIAPNQNLYHVSDLEEAQQPVKPITYSVVKHGIIGMSKYFATYWAQNSIRSNVLCPGGVDNMQPQIFVDRFKELVPLKRMARPNEYKGAIKFLLSDESSYMTGSTIVIDGGRSTW